MTRILWDVDTQVDFMEPSGKLYVPDAKAVAPAMERLVDAARAARLVHVASADDHELTDPEISDRPNGRSSGALPTIRPRRCISSPPAIRRTATT